MNEKHLQKRILNVLKQVSNGRKTDANEINSLISLISEPKTANQNLFTHSFYEFFKNAKNAIAIYEAVDSGKDFVFVDFNPVAEKLEKIKKSKVIGKKVTEVFPGIKQFGLLKVFTNVWKTGKPQDHPFSAYKDNRIVTWRENHVYKLTSGHIVSIYRDVTNEKIAQEKLEKSELSLKSLIDNNDDSIWSIDTNYNYIIFNNHFQKQYFKAYKVKLQIGLNALDLLTKEQYKFWKKNYDKALSGKKFSFEFNVQIGKNTNYFKVSLSPIVAGKEIKGVSALSVDITERINTENKLRLSEENYRGIFNSSSDAIYIQDKNGIFVDVNSGAEKMYGYRKEFFINKTPEFISAPGKNDLKMVMSAVSKAYNGTKQKFEYWGLRKNGEIFPKDVTLNPGTYNGEKIVVALAQDISIRKKAEEDIRKSEVNFKNLIEFAPDAFFHGNSKGDFINCNKAAIKLTGYSKRDLRSMNISDLFSKKIIENNPLRYDLLNLGRVVRTERILKRKDNTEILVEMTSRKMSDGTLQSFMRDITEKKKSENALKESERNFRLLFENSPLGTYIANTDGTIIDVNKTLLNVLGSPSVDATKSINALKFPPLVKNGYAAIFRKCVKENKIQTLEIPYTSKWGKDIFLSSYIIPLANNEGKVQKVYTIMEDITLRKNSENALRESEEKYKLISDSTSDYLFSTLINQNGNDEMDWVGGSFETITGYTFDEYLEIGGWVATLHLEDVYIDKSAFEELKNNRKIEIEVRIFKKDRSIIWVRCSASPVWSKEEKRVVSILGAVKDITKEKKAELAIKKSEEKYKLISGLTSDYLFSTIIDKNGNSILDWVGGSFEEITGYTLEEYIKVGGWRSTLHKDDIKIDDSAFSKLVKNQKARIEVRTFHKSGKIVWVETFGSPVWDKKSNRLIGINGAVRDITKEKEVSLALEKSEEKYKLISSLTSDYLSELSFKNYDNVETIWIAGSFKKITGYTIEEYKKAGDWLAHIYPDDIEVYKGAMLKLQNNRKVNYQIRFFHKSGSVHWLDKSCSPIWDVENNRLSGVIDANRDITEEKQTQLVQEIQYNVANAIVVEKNTKSLFDFLRSELSKILNTSNFYIAFYDENTGMLNSDIDSDEKDKIETWPKGKSISGYLIDSGEKLHIYKEDILKLKDEGKLELIGTLPEVWLGVPLKEKNNVVGVMVIQSYKNRNAFDKKSIELFEVIGNQISLYLERDKAKEDALRLSRAIVQSPVSVVITSPEGVIEYVNPRFEKVSGYTFEEAYGQNPRILKSDEHDEVFYKNLWETILSGQDWKGEILNKKKNGDLYWENVIISPIQNNSGAITHFVSIKEDMTERKQMIRDIIKAKEDAISSEKIKTEFLAQMSHEIRSPLNVVLSFIGLIKDEMGNSLSEDMAYSFQSIDSASSRIIRTIELILNMTDIQLGTFNISIDSINVIEMLDQVKSEYIQTAKNKELNLNLHIDFKRKVISSDEYALRQIVSNLVDNAIKYTDSGRIDIYAENDKSSGLIIKVKDTGIGMKKEYLPTLFNAFTQEEQGYTRKFDGNGLGMALVKNYCTLISAKISVESEKGKGSMFTLHVPNLKN